MSSDHRIVLVTAPAGEAAARIAHALVAERLAACVNIVPGCRSIFRWEGRTWDADESLMIIKTRAEHLERLERRVVELHPYDVPEVIALAPVAMLEAYARFIDESVCGESGGAGEDA